MGRRAGVDGAFEPHAAASSAQQASARPRRRSVMDRMVEPTTWKTSGRPSPRAGRLTLDSPVGAIDRQLAARRVGLRTKGPPASEVLGGAGDLDGPRPPPSLPPPLHRPLAGLADRGAEDRGVRDGDRPREAGHQAADPAPPVDGHDHAVRRLGVPGPHVLQPALDGIDVQGGLRGRGLGHRAAVPRPAPAREPGDRAPQERRPGPGPHGPDHPDPPGDRGHHDADDPRARVARARAAPRPARPDARGPRPGRVAAAVRPARSGTSTSPGRSPSSPRRSSG